MVYTTVALLCEAAAAKWTAETHDLLLLCSCLQALRGNADVLGTHAPFYDPFVFIMYHT